MYFGLSVNHSAKDLFSATLLLISGTQKFAKDQRTEAGRVYSMGSSKHSGSYCFSVLYKFLPLQLFI